MSEDNDRISTTLSLKYCAGSPSVEVDCPLLAILAPEVYFAKRWDCGPQTFEFLLAFLLDARGYGDDDRQGAEERIREGKWQMFYRDAPIYCGAQTPEDKLWPA